MEKAALVPLKGNSGAGVYRFHWPRAVKVLSPGADEPRSESTPSLTFHASGELLAVVDEKVCRL